MKNTDNIKSDKERRYLNKVTVLLGIMDILSIAVAYGMALWIRFDFKMSTIPYEYYTGWVNSLIPHVIISIIIYMIIGLYRSLWNYVSMDEMQRTFVSSVVSVILYIILMHVFFIRMPVSYYIIGWLLEFGFITFSRYSYRGARKAKNML